ncbi:MAG: APC family permease [Thermoproteus sp.]
MQRRLRLRDLVALGLAGILPVGAPIGVAPLVKYAGESAIWPALLGYAMVLLSAVPILEYSRSARFAGGYYGLAELGLGPLAGKYTAVANYLYYVAWQAQNALQAGWVVYGITGSPAAWAAAVVGVLSLSYAGASSQPRRYAGDVLIPALAFTASITAALDVYVIAASPYKTSRPLFPGDWSGVAVAAAVQGFWMYVGYGTPLFYSEEAESPSRDVWRAVVISTTISAALYVLSAYAVVAAVPPSAIGEVAASPMPYVDAWSRYLPAWLLAAYPLLIAPAVLAYGGPSGSHARLLWAMARDGFVGYERLKELDRNGVPRNAALFNLAASSAFAAAAAAYVFVRSGLSPASAEIAWLFASTAATVLWYAHHLLPEIALYPYLRRAGQYRRRAFLVGVVAPIAGTAILVSTLYVTASTRLQYTPAICAGIALSVAALLYTLLRRAQGRLGSSTIHYYLSEK